MPDPRFLGEGLSARSVLFASEQDDKLEVISYVDETRTNGLSRNSSILSSTSVTSPTAGPSISVQTIPEDAEMGKPGSAYSMDSDEETSRNIATKKDSSVTPKNKRKDQLRTGEKDKNRISFRLFKGNRKSQLHEWQDEMFDNGTCYKVHIGYQSAEYTMVPIEAGKIPNSTANVKIMEN